MLILGIIIPGAVFCIILLIIYKREKKSNTMDNGMPKGPNGIPLFGAMYKLIGAQPHIVFNSLRKKYGDMYTFNFGPFKSLIINDWKLMKEILGGLEGCGRDRGRVFLARCVNEGNHGILFSTGKTWSEQRRFTLKTLRDFGFGKKSMEEMILFEVEDLIEKLHKLKNVPINIDEMFTGSVLNALWSIISGERPEDDNLILHQIYDKLAKVTAQTNPLYFYPWLFNLDKYLGKLWPNNYVSDFLQDSQYNLDCMRKTVEDHKKTRSEDFDRDFIDVYLREIEKTTDTESSFYGINGESNLITLMSDLIAAGAETTATTITWTFLYLAINQAEQIKFHDEIKREVGISNSVKLENRPRLPYCEAVILEVLRYCAIIPLIPRTALEDINGSNFKIPKGTRICGNAYAALWDKDYWGDPGVFRPARFLSDLNDPLNVDGTRYIKKHDAFISFSLGKRTCLGESLARDELFLFLTNIFQRFRIIPDPKNGPFPGKIQNFVGATLTPKIFPIILKEWA